MGGNSQSRQARAQSESQTSAPVSSLDKTQAHVIINPRDAVTAVRPLTDQQLKSLTAPPNPERSMRFIQKMYSTITAHTRSFQAFFCIAPPRSCHDRWKNVGRPLLLCNSVHLHYIIFCRTPSIQRQHGVFIFMSIFHPLTPKQAHLSVCLFSVYYSLSCDPLSPTTESADRILYLPR